MPETACPLVMLASGQSLKLRRVMLYNEEDVTEIATLRAQAMKSLGGVSTGIGFIGSPEWVLGGAAALGILEGLLSGAVKKQGVEALQKAKQKTEELAKAGVLFEASELLECPHPSTAGMVCISHCRT
jgi:hypothetical protein